MIFNLFSIHVLWETIVKTVPGQEGSARQPFNALYCSRSLRMMYGVKDTRSR